MSDYSESEEECCARLSAALESRLTFQHDIDWAEQGGGASRNYNNSFHVDSFDEDDIDDLVFTSTLPTNHICQVLEAPKLKSFSPIHSPAHSPEYATPIYPQGSNGDAIDEDSDGGWNSDDPDIFRPQTTPPGTTPSTSKRKSVEIVICSI